MIVCVHKNKGAHAAGMDQQSNSKSREHTAGRTTRQGQVDFCLTLPLTLPTFRIIVIFCKGLRPSWLPAQVSATVSTTQASFMHVPMSRRDVQGWLCSPGSPNMTMTHDPGKKTAGTGQRWFGSWAWHGVPQHNMCSMTPAPLVALEKPWISAQC